MRYTNTNRKDKSETRFYQSLVGHQRGKVQPDKRNGEDAFQSELIFHIKDSTKTSQWDSLSMLDFCLQKETSCNLNGWRDDMRSPHFIYSVLSDSQFLWNDKLGEFAVLSDLGSLFLSLILHCLGKTWNHYRLFPLDFYSGCFFKFLL